MTCSIFAWQIIIIKKYSTLAVWFALFPPLLFLWCTHFHPFPRQQDQKKGTKKRSTLLEIVKMSVECCDMMNTYENSTEIIIIHSWPKIEVTWYGSHLSYSTGVWLVSWTTMIASVLTTWEFGHLHYDKVNSVPVSFL